MALTKFDIIQNVTKETGYRKINPVTLWSSFSKSSSEPWHLAMTS